ncbi:hypothetical protein [Neisseria perflava]|uniref:hypothetical protein n=1 Tax=Neisseria perflava TaxID=33053 RepID=UPI0020A05FFF|nr:hypothetical protein [Neisseria perflava]MCP1660399.1 hypothetical protein [Neisseria perflava]
MSFTLKTGISLASAAVLLGLGGLACANPVYTCVSPSGQKTYTSEPTPVCKNERLPGVDSYPGGVYKLKTAQAKLAREQERAKSENKKRRKKSSQAPRNKNRREKGSNGLGSFPVTTR